MTSKAKFPKLKEIRISKLVEIFKIIEKYPSLKLFRGQSDASWKLIPRISRLYEAEKVPDTWPRLESFILDEFKQYAVININKEPRSKFEWMSIGQHYGLPTRLLDWTTNPLKASYFAIAENYEKDGALFALSPSAWIPKFEADDDIDMIKHLIPVFPDMIDSRIVAQEGCFTIFPHAPDKKPYRPLEDTTAYNASYLMMLKIVIPRDKKRTFRHDLNKLGVNSRTLFPDLSGLSDFIAWKFKEGMI
ncbi:FRG domain protein [Candidatus Zixiibacteriota bacterium]|nr:FRG domain protein [candidate division Zixibacteria bacterium]